MWSEKKGGTWTGRGIAATRERQYRHKNAPDNGWLQGLGRKPTEARRTSAPAVALQWRTADGEDEHARTRPWYHQYECGVWGGEKSVRPEDDSRRFQSGGTAAGIATRMAPAGLGSDTGGSVRIPAALCGVAGLRPSVGNGEKRYSAQGVIPLSHTRDTVGPMGRTVADVALLDSVITGQPMPQPVLLKGLLPSESLARLSGRILTVS